VVLTYLALAKAARDPLQERHARRAINAAFTLIRELGA
jgi:hypothetical protein